jgi:hypothetical protein
MSRRTLPVRRLAVAALVPLALTTLAACSDGEDSTVTDTAGASTSTSSEASESPASESPASESDEVEVAEGEEIDPAAFMDVFEAAFTDASAVHLTMDMTTAVGDISAEGDADYSATPPSVQMTMAGGMLGEGIDVVMIDGVMYMQIPGMGAEGQYYKLDLNDPNNPLGSSFTAQLDPKAMFEQFEDSLDSVVYNGEQDVDGDTADAYTVTVDAAAVFEGQGQTVPPGVDLPDAFTYQVYFADDLFRRMEIDMGDTLGQVTMDLTDWGKDVSIEAPPADLVTDFPDLGSLVPSAGASS